MSQQQPTTSTPEIVIGRWYKYSGPSNNYLRTGQRIKVLDYDPDYTGDLFPSVTVWGMGPARADDEAGIGVWPNQLAPLDQ